MFSRVTSKLQDIWPNVMNENACKMGTKKKRTMKADEREAVEHFAWNALIKTVWSNSGYLPREITPKCN